MRAISVIASSLSLFLACSSNNRSQETAPAAAPSPIPLDDVLSAANPYQLYVDLYDSFRFTSHSKFQAVDGGVSRTFEGKTALERDEFGNFRLDRTPLYGSAVELVYVNHEAYLRKGVDAQYRIVPYQPEFEQWAIRSFREILSLYESQNFPEGAQEKNQGALQCWLKKAVRLCIDPRTGLPLEGIITASSKDQPNPEIRFSVTPTERKRVSISAPQR